jgi:hypothetical protein
MTKSAKRKLNLIKSIKMVVGALAVSTYFMDHEKIAFWMLVSGAVLDGVVNYYTNEIEISKEK